MASSIQYFKTSKGLTNTGKATPKSGALAVGATSKSWENLAMANIFSVEYEINAQNWRDGQFSIPKKVADILSLQPGSNVIVEITSSKGTKSFIMTIKSGLELYGLSDHVESQELVRVRVTHAPTPIS